MLKHTETMNKMKKKRYALATFYANIFTKFNKEIRLDIGEKLVYHAFSH